MEKLRNILRSLDSRILLGILAVSALIAVYAAAQLLDGLGVYARAAGEYAELREEYGPQLPAQPASAQAEAAPGPVGLNPDYVGWLRIDGTGLDYPVVQGADNSHYLTTSFLGAESKLGAIFLDFRCEEGLASDHAILYGHNARDGSMFSSLLRYLEEGYLEQHPDIQVTLPDGAEETYRIFAVGATDVTDPAYRLAFEDEAAFSAFAVELGAPGDAERILTLSTCLDDGDLDSRLLVHAAAGSRGCCK